MGGRVTRSLLRNQAAGQVCQPRDLVFNTPILELVHDLLCGTRIPVAGGANLYCGSPGEHELNDVGGSRHSSHAHHRDLYDIARAAPLSPHNLAYAAAPPARRARSALV